MSVPFSWSQVLWRLESGTICSWSTEKSNRPCCPSPSSPTKFEISQAKGVKNVDSRNASPFVSLWEVTLLCLVCKSGWVEASSFVVFPYVYGLFKRYINGKWGLSRYWLIWYRFRLKHSCFYTCNFNITVGKICFWHVLFDKPLYTHCLGG